METLCRCSSGLKILMCRENCPTISRCPVCEKRVSEKTLALLKRSKVRIPESTDLTTYCSEVSLNVYNESIMEELKGEMWRRVTRPTVTVGHCLRKRRRPDDSVRCPAKKKKTSNIDSDSHLRDVALKHPDLFVDMSILTHMLYPERWATAIGAKYCTIYVPHLREVCDRLCAKRQNLTSKELLGRGSFGEVWKPSQSNLVLKVAQKRNGDLGHTLWVSGLVRYQSRLESEKHLMKRGKGSRCKCRELDPNDGRTEIVSESGRYLGSDPGVMKNILIALTCCVKHQTTISIGFQMDLYRFHRWSLREMGSYQRAFAGLGDALRFLNLKCRVSHSDVAPWNILVDTDPERPSRLTRAVICDFSLVSPHLFWRNRCAVILEETSSVKILPVSDFTLVDSNHPAFRPMVLQKLICVNPCSKFPQPSSKRLCIAELCALANVATFILVRLLDERGLAMVMKTYEKRLFDAAGEANEAMQNEDMDRYANACSLVFTIQMAYSRMLLGSRITADTVDQVERYFLANYNQEAAISFRNELNRVQDFFTDQYVSNRLERMSMMPEGVYFLESLIRAYRIISSEHLSSLSPTDIFPNCETECESWSGSCNSTNSR